MSKTKTCRCGEVMHEGFIPDHGDVASTWASIWVAGTPQGKQGLWQKMTKGHGVQNWADEEAWALTAYRCSGCGLVELYATERPDPETTLKKA